jgi:hypothetical protein
MYLYEHFIALGDGFYNIFELKNKIRRPIFLKYNSFQDKYCK